MKKILILGASGLIGHKLLQELSSCPELNIFCALHKKKVDYNNSDLFNNNVFYNIEAANFENIDFLLNDVYPDVILNCIGITKRKEEILNSFLSIKINALFPHFLSDWAIKNSKKVIHFSTDCVFDGKVGNYTESNLTTAEDNYGRTKALGEIIDNHNITIRSSFIGQELFGKTELLDWFLSMEGKKIKGYTNMLYSGVSSVFMSKVIKKIILNFSDLSGLFQLATDNPISKYNLLCLARDIYNIDVEIIPDGSIISQPTLNGAKLKEIMKINVPDWSVMLSELEEQKKQYN